MIGMHDRDATANGNMGIGEGCLRLTENTQVSWDAFETFPRHRGQVDVTAERNVSTR